MTQFSLAKRYGLVMTTGVLIDLVFYLIAHYAKMPAWMDANGTAYAAMLLEPAAGLLVGFFVNFVKASLMYSPKDLVAYALNASVALIFGLGMRKAGLITLKRLLPMGALFVLTNTILGLLVGLWQGGLISGWEVQFSTMALSWGAPALVAQTFGVFVLKAADGVIMVAVLFLAYHLTPKRWMNEQHNSTVSWKTPFWPKSKDSAHP